MIRWLTSWFNAHRRAVDIAILWPACKRRAADLDHAKVAFAVHAFKDRAWLALPHDEIVRIITELQ